MEKLYDESDNGFIGISFNKEMNEWIMHIECHSWSHTKFKRYLKGLEKVKQDSLNSKFALPIRFQVKSESEIFKMIEKDKRRKEKEKRKRARKN